MAFFFAFFNLFCERRRRPPATPACLLGPACALGLSAAVASPAALRCAASSPCRRLPHPPGIHPRVSQLAVSRVPRVAAAWCSQGGGVAGRSHCVPG
jgi:hypothetical protein